MNRTEVTTIDDLPELPFNHVLSYLSLEDVITSRDVSPGWCERIKCYRVKTLCCSRCPVGFNDRRRLISGALAQNFIGFTDFTDFIDFEQFFNEFGQTILTSLKHLRLCDYVLCPANLPALIQTLNSFGQLEQLEMDVLLPDSNSEIQLIELNLPKLKSIQLVDVGGIEKLTLDTPRLQKVKFWDCRELSVVIVHSESVERLLIDHSQYLPVKNLKNLKQLYISGATEIDPTFLSSLEQLREISLESLPAIQELFEQKRRYGRADLKIYRFGCLLDGPVYPASARFTTFTAAFAFLAENPTRLTDELPLCRNLPYSAIEPVATESAINVLKRLVDLQIINVNEPVRDVQHFLDLLKSLDISLGLYFWSNQPQDLFDRLPDHYASSSLSIEHPPSDHQFLFRLKGLVDLRLWYSVDSEFILRIWQELPRLSSFKFSYLVSFQVEIEVSHSKQFWLWINGLEVIFSNLADVIQFIVDVAIEPDSDSDEHSDEDEEEEEDDDEEDDEEADEEMEVE